VGKLRRCGGAGPGCVRQYHAIVSVFDAQHRLVAKKRVRNGHFSFQLRPGQYRLIAERHGEAPAKRSVTAQAGQTVHASLTFQVK
jgi:hypothetical protein